MQAFEMKIGIGQMAVENFMKPQQTFQNIIHNNISEFEESVSNQEDFGNCSQIEEEVSTNNKSSLSQQTATQ